MHDIETLTGTLLDDADLTLEQVATACLVEPAWLIGHIEADLFPQVEHVAGRWCFTPAALVRARRMHALERDFDAVPELAALMADLLEEMDTLRTRLRCAGLR
ncbi:MAG: MerR family transcriptional regulator [Thiobacillus sp.]|nr:MerR family transcriptional regulator [Thiobacillus sp.]